MARAAGEPNAKRLTQKLLRGGKRMHASTRKKLYRHLIHAAERTMAKALEVRVRIEKGEGRTSSIEQVWALQALSLEIAHYLPLAEKCVYQARERVLNGNAVPHDKKIFSIFEPHTELLIRGKAGKEIEFGHMVEINQVEGGLITNYATHLKRPVEPPLLIQAVEKHAKLFGHVPETGAGDKGFYSKDSVAKLEVMGVSKVCVAKKGRRNDEEEKREKSFWFKAAQAFRAGIEGTISVLKRAFGLRRCLREGFKRIESWVATGVLAHNLVLLSRR